MTPKDILQLESSDMRQAYLFEENGRWYAYEHSANRIEKFVKGFVDFRHKVHKSRNRPQHIGKVFHYTVRRFTACT